MNLVTLLLYLVGNRRATLDVAHSRGGLWLGLVFVLSAGLAREYDGADLLREPWHALIPLAASLGSSLTLFVLIYIVSSRRQIDDWPLAGSYRAVLQLFWMTAPLAWLYAIPFERFLSPADATRANVYLLGGIALWRVLLMSRAVAVLFQVRFVAALAVVMLFADTVALVVLYATPLPIVNIMGGVRLTESEQFIRSVAEIVGVLGVVSWPLWLVGAVVAAFAQRWTFVADTEPSTKGVGWDLRLLAGMSLAVWSVVLPFTQPEQRNRWQVETALRANRLEEALAYMSARRREDFPPHWDPPPHVGYGERVPSLIEMRKAVEDESVASWVRKIFVGKLAFQKDQHSLVEFDYLPLEGISDDDLRRVLLVLSKIPEGPRIAKERREFADLELEKDTTPQRRALLEEFLRLADLAAKTSDGAPQGGK